MSRVTLIDHWEEKGSIFFIHLVELADLLKKDWTYFSKDNEWKDDLFENTILTAHCDKLWFKTLYFCKLIGVRVRNNFVINELSTSW